MMKAVISLVEESQNQLNPIAIQRINGLAWLDHSIVALRKNGIEDITLLCNPRSVRNARLFAQSRSIPSSKVLSIVDDVIEGNTDMLFLNSNVKIDEQELVEVISRSEDCVIGQVLSQPVVAIVRKYSVKKVLGALSEQSDVLDLIVEHFLKGIVSQMKNSVEVSFVNTKILHSDVEFVESLNSWINLLQQNILQLPKEVVETCPARVGLMGNPSDGFGGKTISFLIDNFKATVTVKDNNNQGVKLIDPVEFQDLSDLYQHSAIIGYTTGLRLLQATCKMFTYYCYHAGIVTHLVRTFDMTYHTNIPRMVGLSGSSAIVVSAFRALLTFYGLTLADLKIQKQDFPQIILNIEKEELGISADRKIV